MPFAFHRGTAGARKFDELIAAARSTGTQRAYTRVQAEYSRFHRAATRSDGAAFPVARSVLHAWLGSLAQQRVRFTTYQSYFAAVNAAHMDAGGAPLLECWQTRLGLRGAERVLSQPPRRATPLRTDFLAAMVAASSGVKPTDVRDRALLFVQYQATLRGPSELLRLRVADVSIAMDGFRLCVGADGPTKSTPNGQSFVRDLPDPAATHLRAWLALRRRLGGPAGKAPLFCALPNDDSVIAPMFWLRPLSRTALASVLKAWATRLHYPAASAVSTHSLRRGRITDLAAHGVSIPEIQQLSGHRSNAVLAYIEPDAAARWRLAASF